MQLLQALLNTVLPVFILAGLGFMLRRVLKVEVKHPATMAMYVLTPGLIANSILTSKLEALDVGKIIVFALTLTAALILVTLAVGRVAGWSVVSRNASVLATGFMNSSNIGLPVVLFAFGQAGFDRAAVWVVIETLLMYTVAAFFAARGKLNWRQSARAVFKLPLSWAALISLAIRLLSIPLPQFITKPVGLLANGAPVVLVMILGMQVAGIQLKGNLGKIGLLALIRLVISPVIALGLMAWLRPEPLIGKVLVLESAMPTAVNVTLLAVQFDAEPDQVSSVTLVSTLFALITLSFWVWYLSGAR